MRADLPADREKALEAIADGWTRTPTTAHPDCLCGGRAQYCRIRGYSEIAGKIFVLRRHNWPQDVPCPIHQRRR